MKAVGEQPEDEAARRDPRGEMKDDGIRGIPWAAFGRHGGAADENVRSGRCDG